MGGEGEKNKAWWLTTASWLLVANKRNNRGVTYIAPCIARFFSLRLSFRSIPLTVKIDRREKVNVIRNAKKSPLFALENIAIVCTFKSAYLFLITTGNRIFFAKEERAL